MDKSDWHGLDAYIRSLGPRPQFNAEQERALALRMRLDSDPKAMELLVRSVLMTVIKVAHKQARSSVISVIDLVQEGNVEVLRALADFDPERGMRLNTYVFRRVRQRLRDLLVKAIRVRQAHEKFISGFHRPDDSSNPDPPAIGRLDREALGLMIFEAMRGLPLRERIILELCFGLGPYSEHSCRQIGRFLNLSHARVAKLIGQALDYLRGDMDLLRAMKTRFPNGDFTRIASGHETPQSP